MKITPMVLFKGRRRTKPWIYPIPAIALCVDRYVIKVALSWIVFDVHIGVLITARDLNNAHVDD